MNITISPEAANNIRQLQLEYDAIGHGIRFGLTTAGCSGYKYVIEFEESSTPSDMVLQSQGIIIYVDSIHESKLKGSEIDWKESAFLSGFQVNNPQAKQPCGCGESINFIEE